MRIAFKYSGFLAAAWAAASAPAAPAARADAQDFVLDTLAVRIILDQNGRTDLAVAQVAEIDAASLRVTGLRLGGLGLASLPSQIGALDALESLQLQDNLLDSLPGELFGLPHLASLDLRGNHLGALDARVGRLSSLLFLGLGGNGLAALPDSLFALADLETLLLGGNALDTLPEAVGGLPFLRYLDVSGNLLRALPFTLPALAALDTLDASDNLIASLPPGIQDLRPQAAVRLAGNRLCDIDAATAAWAASRDPSFAGSQVCSQAVRRATGAFRGAVLRVFARPEGVRLSWPAAVSPRGGGFLVLRDAAGRTLVRRKVETGVTEITIWVRVSGFAWAELIGGRGEPGVVARAGFLP